MKQLIKDLHTNPSERSAILAHFWDEVKSAGIPFFEPCDDAHFLATFLFEGDENTKTVNLGANFMSRIDEDPQNWLMQRLADTNIWYWTEKVTRDLRTGYFVTPNHPSPEGLDAPEKRHAFLKAICLSDPLNNKTFDRPFYPYQLNGANERVLQSVFEAPDATPQVYATKRSSVPQGNVTPHRYQSPSYAYEHALWVYTPPSYDPQRAEAYPLVFLFDGYLYLEALKLPTILDNLLAEEKILPLICVMFNSEAENRTHELAPNDTFPRALAEDWMPFIRKSYHVSIRPEKNIIGGMSLGGLAAAWNSFKNPLIFGNVISQSGSFWWSPSDDDPNEAEEGWLIRQFAHAEKLDIRFYQDIGRYENDDNGKGSSHRSLNRHMRDVLIAKGYPVTYQEYAGFHDHIWWQLTIVDGLCALLGEHG